MVLVFLGITIILLLSGIIFVLKPRKISKKSNKYEDRYLDGLSDILTKQAIPDLEDEQDNRSYIRKLLISTKTKNRIWFLENKEDDEEYQLERTFYKNAVSIAIVFLISTVSFFLLFSLSAYVTIFMIFASIVSGYIAALLSVNFKFKKEGNMQKDALSVFVLLTVLGLRSGEKKYDAMQGALNDIEHPAFNKLKSLLYTNSSETTKLSKKIFELGAKTEIQEVREFATVLKISEDVGGDEGDSLEHIFQGIHENQIQALGLKSSQKNTIATMAIAIFMIGLALFITYPLISAFNSNEGLGLF